ncbi:MAG: zinc-ribbon domain containing protein [Dehalococcoidales bacterium]|nr:zinc-ribbon domain containing protein [Dehalococcoidales bacterium]
MTFQDKSIQCFDCGSSFTFTTAEQELFRSKGHNNEPKRCPSCRQVRKGRQASAGNRNSTPTYQSQQQLFPATCARCGKSTQVPFEPRAGRPVYCRDCYSTVRVGR